MIRLNLSREPSWLDLGHDVRVRVAPLTTSLMAAARSDPAVAALPEGASNETIAVTMAKALARLVVLEWEGVGDAEGNPVHVTPEGIDALLDILPIFEEPQVFGLTAKVQGFETESVGRPTFYSTWLAG